MFCQGGAWAFSAPQIDVDSSAGPEGSNDGAILAPMPGRVVSVEVAEGDFVLKGAKLVVMEAMKMELSLTAPFDGVVAELRARVDDQTSEGALLVRIDKPQH